MKNSIDNNSGELHNESSELSFYEHNEQQSGLNQSINSTVNTNLPFKNQNKSDNTPKFNLSTVDNNNTTSDKTINTTNIYYTQKSNKSIKLGRPSIKIDYTSQEKETQSTSNQIYIKVGLLNNKNIESPINFVNTNKIDQLSNSSLNSKHENMPFSKKILNNHIPIKDKEIIISNDKDELNNDSPANVKYSSIILKRASKKLLDLNLTKDNLNESAGSESYNKYKKLNRNYTYTQNSISALLRNTSFTNEKSDKGELLKVFIKI